MFGFLRRNEKNPEATPDSGNETSENIAETSTSAIKSGASFTPASLRTQEEAPSSTETMTESAAPAAEKSPQDIETTEATMQSGASFTRPTAEDWAKADEERTFTHLRDRLGKTRAGLTDGMADLLLGKKTIDDDLLEELKPDYSVQMLALKQPLALLLILPGEFLAKS